VATKRRERRADLRRGVDRETFLAAVEAELAGWDALLDRAEAKASSTTGLAHERAEKTIVELRRLRLECADMLADLRSETGVLWRDARSHVLAALDDLERRADAAFRD
jgi:hypothetical protein